MSAQLKICQLGLGEVGQVLIEDMARLLPGAHLTAWDIGFADPSAVASAAQRRLGLGLPENGARAVEGTDVIISAVTAAQDMEAARSVLAGMRRGAYFVDLNSASPAMKRMTAALVEGAGGHYVEAVIMSPIGARRMASAMLLGGARARAFLPLAGEIGFSDATFFSEELGLASATKLCRSVIVKGMEALLTESMLAARFYGVEDNVLASLSDLFPGQDWQKLARYMISRGLQHGRRRAEEMREAASTVADAGIEPLMSTATALRQDGAALLAAALAHESLPAMLDAMREQIAMKNGEI